MNTPPPRPGRAFGEPDGLRQLTSFLTLRLMTPASRHAGVPPERLRPAAPIHVSFAAHEQHTGYRAASVSSTIGGSPDSGFPEGRTTPDRASETRDPSDDIALMRTRFAMAPDPGFLAGEEAEIFSFRDLVHGCAASPGLLRHPRIADTAREHLHALDGVLCALDAFVILPTHVHLLFHQQIGLLHGPTPEQVAAVFKTGVERKVREYLGRATPLWERRDFHRYLRTTSDSRAAREFIRRTPVRCGLVERPEEWEWLYVRGDEGSILINREPS